MTLFPYTTLFRSCMLGDFNAIAAGGEKWGGNTFMSAPNKAFRAWTHEVGLIDLGYHGPAYTWCNNQSGRDMICERLDRAMANLAWTVHNPQTAVFHLLRFQSDHHPILVRTKPKKLVGRRQFRSENWWLRADGFDSVCQRVGTSQPLGWQSMADSFKNEASS